MTHPEHRLVGRLFKALFIMMVLFIGAGVALDAHAHSTKGRKKVLIDWPNARIDDLAYYVEPWVAHGMGDLKEDGRYQVREFTSITNQDGWAVVEYVVADRKGPEFLSQMSFARQTDGTWAHVNGSGIVACPLYTYNTPPMSLLSRVVWSAVGIVGIAAAVFGLFMTRRRTALPSGPARTGENSAGCARSGQGGAGG